MGNLTHCTGFNSKNGHDSPGDMIDHGGDQVDGYASEDFVPGSLSTRERKKGLIFNLTYMVYACMYVFLYTCKCRGSSFAVDHVC